MHVPHVADAVDPPVIVLLNLSRDQLDRVGEINHIERTLRAGLARHPRRRGRRQLRRRADDLGRLRQPARGVGGRGRRLGQRLGELPAQRARSSCATARTGIRREPTSSDPPRSGGTTTRTSTGPTDCRCRCSWRCRERSTAATPLRRSPRQSRWAPTRPPRWRRSSGVDEVAGRYRTVRARRAHRADAAGQEPGGLAGGAVDGRHRRGLGGDLGQRPGARRRGPVVAVGRELRALRDTVRWWRPANGAPTWPCGSATRASSTRWCTTPLRPSRPARPDTSRWSPTTPRSCS